MSNSVPKGDFVVVLKRALRDEETRELITAELALYENTKELGGASVNHVSKSNQKRTATSSTSKAEAATLEQRVLELEKIVAKQEETIKAQGNDLVRLWELMEGEISGHHGALAGLLSAQPDFRIQSTDEDEDVSEDGEREAPTQTASRGRPVQTARRSRPFNWRAHRGRGG